MEEKSIWKNQVLKILAFLTLPIFAMIIICLLYTSDFEIRNDKKGKPNVQINTNILDKSLIKNIDISISHCKEYATAVCIIEINN